ncbi:MAG: hypothetical protein IJA10_12895 [Lachnospiraceae bacterium]|nr:hypothetical protein [Lachnospiraceae bacterium]
MLKIIFKRRKAEFAIMLTFAIMFTFLISFLDGYLVSENKKVLDMASIFFGAYISFMVEVLYGVFFLPNEFRLAVSMGKTRKEFLRCEILVTVVWQLLIYLSSGFIFGMGIWVGSIVNQAGSIKGVFGFAETGKSVLLVAFSILLVTVVQFTVFLAVESNEKLVCLGVFANMFGSIYLAKIMGYFNGLADSLSGILSGDFLPLVILISIVAVLSLWGGFVIKKLLHLQVRLH